MSILLKDIDVGSPFTTTSTAVLTAPSPVHVQTVKEASERARELPASTVNDKTAPLPVERVMELNAHLRDPAPSLNEAAVILSVLASDATSRRED